MSEYQNYFSDFGARCFDLYDQGDPVVGDGERDVTKALCVLAAALTIPHERLRPARNASGKILDSSAYPGHPSGDRCRYPQVAEMYDNKLKESFAAAFVLEDGWRKGHLKGAWGEECYTTVGEAEEVGNKCVNGVLFIIRNALTHGYVQTLTKGGKITAVRFFSLSKEVDPNNKKKGEDFETDYILVELHALSDFMVRWKTFLQAIGVKAVSETACSK